MIKNILFISFIISVLVGIIAIFIVLSNDEVSNFYSKGIYSEYIISQNQPKFIEKK